MSDDRLQPLDAEDAVDDGFEERADHVEEGVIRDGSAKGDHFDKVVRQLTSRGLVLLVGPRGCGKTHLMRYAWLSCLGEEAKPFCVYTSLNRYLSLEPWSRNRSDVNGLFHSWVLCRILLAAAESFGRLTGDPQYDVGLELEMPPGALAKLVNNLERNLALDADDEELHRRLSIDVVKDVIASMADRGGRKRSVVLLDDAALTLSPAFMSEFLDILRVLKSPDIAPKCSIYPGTTMFGTRFHADHEGRTESAWVSVGDPNYRGMMQTIAERRYPEGLDGISPEANALLQYAAFGIPRAYLTLLRSVQAERHGTLVRSAAGSQAIVIKVVRAHRNNRISEFRSLGEKLVEMRTLVRVGEHFFNGIVDAIKQANERLIAKSSFHQDFGIKVEEFDPLTTRMVDLLAEAGLLYKADEVSHGPDRQYRRFSPHLAALISARAFSPGTRGTLPGAIVEAIEQRRQKHPVRRAFRTILAERGVHEALKLDLPPCQSCGTPREGEKQRFCQHCGARLVDELIYNRIMDMEIPRIPGISPFLAGRAESANIRTVGDLRALQDPGSELRKVVGIGRPRSLKILGRIDAFVDEMMS